jgi:hypothetical protein
LRGGTVLDGVAFRSLTRLYPASSLPATMNGCGMARFTLKGAGLTDLAHGHCNTNGGANAMLHSA